MDWIVLRRCDVKVGCGFLCLSLMSLSGEVCAQHAGTLSYTIPAYLEFSSPEYSVPGEPTNAVITVVRTGEFREPVSVKYATTGGTALAGTDYLPAQGTLTIAAGVGFASFVVPIRAGGSSTTPKTVQLSLSDASPNGLITRTNANLTILPTGPNSLAPVTPALTIKAERDGQVVVSWPVAAANCILQKAENPAGSEWSDVNEPIEVAGSAYRLAAPPSAGKIFFRLRSNQ